jgi:ATP phosphoribosyltransferase
MQSQQTTSGLTLVLPKQRKLWNGVAPLIDRAGYSIDGPDPEDQGTLYDRAGVRPALRLEFARVNDSCVLLDRGIADIAVIGSDTANEYNLQQGKDNLRLVAAFGGIASCDMALAARPQDTALFRDNPESMNGKRFATSYPATLAKYLKARGIEPTEIVTLDGGVETSIRRGMADIVMDLVQSGKTLRDNGLEKFAVLSTSNAGLYAGPSSRNEDNELYIEKFGERLWDSHKGRNYSPIRSAAYEVDCEMGMRI